MSKRYKVGIYCRLSVDDTSNSAKSRDYIPGDESVSIEHQYEMLSKVVMLNGWVEVKTSRDDGYSGGSFQRPGFLEMLEDAVARLKGEEELLRTETEINLGIPAHIPDTYVEDAHERLKYYKMLSSASDAVTRENVEMEIRDRFGPFPEPLETFLSVLAFKARVNELGVARADLWADRVRVTWAEGQRSVRPEAIVRLVMEHRDRIRLQPPATLELSLKEGLSPAERLDEARALLSGLLEERNGAPAPDAGAENPAEKTGRGHVASVKKTGYKRTA